MLELFENKKILTWSKSYNILKNVDMMQMHVLMIFFKATDGPHPGVTESNVT